MTYIVGSSQLMLTMGELAVLSKWAIVIGVVMLAQLSFILLLQSVKLVSIEVLVVRLLGKMSHHLSWWVIEILLGLAI
jgi:hypothetical protein